MLVQSGVDAHVWGPHHLLSELADLLDGAGSPLLEPTAKAERPSFSPGVPSVEYPKRWHSTWGVLVHPGLGWTVGEAPGGSGRVEYHHKEMVILS